MSVSLEYAHRPIDMKSAMSGVKYTAAGAGAFQLHSALYFGKCIVMIFKSEL